METKKDGTQEVSVTGYFSKEREFNYKYFEGSQKSAINTRIYREGKDKALEGIAIKAFNRNAEKLKGVMEKTEISKVTATGNFKEVTFENKNKEIVTIQELQVTKLAMHKVMEIQGNIAKVEDKQTANGKKYSEILVINNKVIDGVETKDMYNVTVWEERKKSIPAEVKLEKGDKIAVKGEATILENKEGNRQYISINAWNIDQNLKKLNQQIVEKQYSKAAKSSKGSKQDIEISI